MGKKTLYFLHTSIRFQVQLEQGPTWLLECNNHLINPSSDTAQRHHTTAVQTSQTSPSWEHQLNQELAMNSSEPHPNYQKPDVKE
jgi:hypothetical protein